MLLVGLVWADVVPVAECMQQEVLIPLGASTKESL